ncbi:MAG: nuclear transport factor 2 family protein [Acidimicrobiales bacterium]
MTHPNADVIRGAYEAFGRGDFDTVLGLWADDIVWHIGGRGPLSGDYHGKDEVMGFFAKLGELTGGTFRLAIHDVAATDEHVLAIVDITAERDGTGYANNAVHVWHMKDAKAVEFRGIMVDQYADDEFWSS